LVWIKNRTTAGANHLLFDRLRAPAMDMNSMRPDSTSAEAASFDELSGVSTDGFTVAHGGDVNGDGKQIVAWNWDMGADTPTGFGCVTYKGSNAADQIVTGYGFSPDLLWIKDRTGGNSHHIFDKVRGVNQRIRSDSDAAQDSGNDSQRAFLSDGFRLGATGTGITVNGNNYVAWGWDMGGISVSNTDGTLTSTVMANPTYGQSIVKYTGVAGVSNATKVGHGLNSAPEMIILKVLGEAEYWPVWHKDMHSDGGFDRKMYLNDNGGVSGTDQRRVTSVSSTTFGLAEGASTGGYSEANQIGEEHIAYCFHSVSGYSKIGNYTGNGSSTGPSVTLGFRPAFVLIKVADRTDGGNGGWWMFDSTRSFGTAIGNVSIANTNGAELVNNSNLAIDFNSNGFQLKSSYDEINVNNGNYIYMAFAGGVDSMSAFNTTGTIESRVKANTTYGQSIVSYTGNGSNTTVGHGLSSAPEMMIVKRRDTGSTNWWVYHKDNTAAPATDALRLDGTNATTDDNFWNDTAPSASLINLGTYGDVNANNGTFIAYCFHSVSGYSKIGGYTGNGSTTGTTVTLGFRPAWLLIKSTNVADSWFIMDTTRSPESNPINTYLH